MLSADLNSQRGRELRAARAFAPSSRPLRRRLGSQSLLRRPRGSSHDRLRAARRATSNRAESGSRSSRARAATLSANGNIVRVTIVGTYAVNPDRTGVMTRDVSPLGLRVNADFVIVRDGWSLEPSGQTLAWSKPGCTRDRSARVGAETTTPMTSPRLTVCDRTQSPETWGKSSVSRGARRL